MNFWQTTAKIHASNFHLIIESPIFDKLCFLMSCCYKCLWPDPADKVPGSGKVNKVWDFLGCLSLLLDRGDKCKDLEPGDPPPAEAEEVLRRITGGTREKNLSF